MLRVANAGCALPPFLKRVEYFFAEYSVSPEAMDLSAIHYMLLQFLNHALCIMLRHMTSCMFIDLSSDNYVKAGDNISSIMG